MDDKPVKKKPYRRVNIFTFPPMSGKRFRMALENLGLSNYKAADFLGVGRSTIIRCCHGRSPIPRATAMLLTSMELQGITPEQMIELTSRGST